MLSILLTTLVPLLIGLATSYYYSHRKSISFMAMERKVQDPIGTEHQIEIKFEGEVIESLSEWVVAVWNSGNTTIHDSEIESPLNFRVTNSRVLRTTDPVARPPIKPTIRNTPDGIKLEFRYLNKMDSILFSIYTTRAQGGDNHIQADVDIRGIPYGFARKSAFEITSIASAITIVSVVVAISACIILNIAAIIELGNNLGLWALTLGLVHPEFPESIFWRWSVLIGLFLFSGFLLLMVWGGLAVTLTSFVRVPPEIRKRFAEEVKAWIASG